jgi:hypothetical protein
MVLAATGLCVSLYVHLLALMDMPMPWGGPVWFLHVDPGEGTTIRGFSGHWLVFYGLAFATLYSVQARPQLLDGVKCPNGHDVDPMAQYCSACGARIARTDAPDRAR